MRDNVPRGEGERRDSARRRKKWLIVAALAVAGAVPGFYIGLQHGKAVAESRPFVWSPTFALVFAGIYLLAVIGGGLLLGRYIDEVERQRSYQAVSFAGLALMVVYPTWFLLWKGGFVPEPIHWVLFVLFWLSLALASLWYRFRQG
jgi:protein-S-isoprenylcysteine O-methyltransferase Ste14